MVCWTPSSKTTANCIEVARQLADLGGEPYDCRLHCFKTSHHLTSQSVSHEFEVRACWSLSKAAGASLQRSSGKCASCNGNGINESRLHDDQVSGRLQLKAPCDGLVSQCLVRASTMSRACSGSGIRIVPTTAEVRRAGLNVCLSSLERSQRPLSKLRGSLQKLPLLERKVPGACPTSCSHCVQKSLELRAPAPWAACIILQDLFRKDFLLRDPLGHQPWGSKTAPSRTKRPTLLQNLKPQMPRTYSSHVLLSLQLQRVATQRAKATTRLRSCLLNSTLLLSV